MSSIFLQNVSLDYLMQTGTNSLKKRVLHTCQKLLTQRTLDQSSFKNTSFRALDNISMEIHYGDRIGLLGMNGAGKSTLLRVLAQIYTPSHGKIIVQGKTSNLFDVNLGMNVEATGYENIINLAIMRGLSKKIANDIVNDVESFTELGKFLSNPVRTYSAGMQMKLAFAVATATTPEIMLIDEIIGVGDSHFMQKATQRLENMIERSHILVLTSHANSIIERFCNKVAILKQGKMIYFGDIKQGIDYYQHQS